MSVLPLNTAQNAGYDNLPAIPVDAPLGDIIDELSAWAGVGSGGDTAAIDTLVGALTTIGAGYQVYVSPAGSDSTGSGTLASPFRSLQHAADVVAEAARRARFLGAQMRGLLQIRCAPGDYSSVVVPEILSSGYLSIRFVGVSGEAPDETWTLPVGTRPANPSRSATTKAAVWQYNVGAYATAITNASHWIDFTYPYGAGQWTYGVLIDGLNSTSPNIRLVTPTDANTSYAGTSAKLRPFTCRVVPDASAPLAGGFITVGSNNPNTTGNILVEFVGFMFGHPASDFQSSLETAGVSLFACNLDNVTWGVSAVENKQFTVHLLATSFCQLLGGCNTYYSSCIFDAYTVFAGALAETFIGGIIRGKDGSGVAMYLGGVTGGRAGSGAYEVEFCDMDALGGAAGAHILVNGARARFGNHGPFTVDGTSFFRAINQAFVTMGNVSGGSSNLPCAFESGTVGTALGGLQGQLVNLATPGNEDNIFSVKSAAGVVSPIAFAALPYADLTVFSRLAP